MVSFMRRKLKGLAKQYEPCAAEESESENDRSNFKTEYALSHALCTLLIDLSALVAATTGGIGINIQRQGKLREVLQRE